MKRLIYILLTVVISVWPLSAREFRGRVVDESGNPLSYVSVYLKSNPVQGSATDDNGVFSLDLQLPSEKGEEIVFSFIGYKTEERWLREFVADEEMVITLVEQPIMLDAATVTTKISRKESKKLKQTALDKFVAQIKRDFPPRTTVYPVVSSYSGSQDSRQLIYHEIIGAVTEHNVKKRKGGDSISLKVSQIKENLSRVVEPTYARFNDIATEKIDEDEQKRKKKGYSKIYTPRDLDAQTVNMHRFLWGGYTGSIFDLADVEKLKRWDVTLIGDETVLSYTDSYNMLGMARMKLVMLFYVDPVTYELKKIAQSVDGELHIPFGYKLDDEQLELLNMLQMGHDTLDRYRLRHAYVTVERNVFFKKVDGKRVVSEKNANVRLKALDNKKKKLTYSARSKVIVTK